MRIAEFENPLDERYFHMRRVVIETICQSKRVQKEEIRFGRN